MTIVITEVTILTVFHGTDAKFNSFDNKFLGAANGRAPINRAGFNFCDSKSMAATFGETLLTAEVWFSKPFTIDAKGKGYSEFKETLNNRLEKFDRRKHDAIIIKNYGDCGIHGDDHVVCNHYIVLNPKQIKIKERESTVPA